MKKKVGTKKSAKAEKSEEKVAASTENTKETVKKDNVKKKVGTKPKMTKKEIAEAKKAAERTLEEELEEQLSPAEIENFQIEKVDMDRLTSRVYDILAERESTGMLQGDLWRRLKLNNRNGSRLALKLERQGMITRVKLLEKGRWTYRLILKKTPISTRSIEGAPCLTCQVEQKCTLDGEISPRTCQLIEDWVIEAAKKQSKSK